MKKLLVVFLGMFVMLAFAGCGGKSEGDINSAKTKEMAEKFKDYTGATKDGIPNGKGKMTYSDGSVYEGDWLNGERNGKGRIIWANGDIYEGTWKDDKQNGKGVKSWVDGRLYEGEYKDGLKSGTGTMTWPDGRKFVGTYVNDERNGKGTYTNYEIKSPEAFSCEYADDECGAVFITLQGQFENGVPQNPEFLECTESVPPTFYLNEESTAAYKGTYTGDFVNGVPDGEGVFTYKDGQPDDGMYENVTYKGHFKNGVFDGKGHFKLEQYEGGLEYQGSFKNGRFNGYGKLEFGGA